MNWTEIDSASATKLTGARPALYVVAYGKPVRRTNVYLSAVEQAALDAKAAAEGP